MTTSGWASSSDSWSSDLYDEDFLAALGEHEAGDVGMHMGEGDGDRRLRSLDDTILLANLDRYVVISESMSTGALLLNQNAKLTHNHTVRLFFILKI
jgi:hypothetical protein